MSESEAARTAVLFSGHFANQARRGSMHWLADELLKHGWRVRFVTFGFSWVSILTRDVRLRNAERRRTGLHEVRPGLDGYFQYTPFHPIDLRHRWLNQIAAPAFALFPGFWTQAVQLLTGDADLVVLESGLPLLLAPTVKDNSEARLVYRVNDDVRILRTPPVVREAELRYAPLFDRISLASPVLARRFEGLGCIGLDPMGLDATIFDQPHPSPYQPRWAREVVSAGTSHFDADAVRAMAALRPDWRFHIIGRLREPISGPNIVWHGEKHFSEVVPFVQHADIGLAPYRDLPGVAYQVHHSNRLLQYAHLKLPTLGPMSMTHADAPHLIGYVPGNTASLELALAQADAMERAALPREVPGWDALYRGIVSVCV